MRRAFLTYSISTLLFAAASAGCSVVVDDALKGKPDDGGTSVVTTCQGAAAGTPCTGGRICVDSVCAESRCGDGFIDSARGEQCEDRNGDPGDGCEPTDCTFSCANDTDCNDDDVCNGTATCDVGTHRCTSGTLLPDGAECSLASAPPSDGGIGVPDGGVGDAGIRDGAVSDGGVAQAGQCRTGRCVPPGCGNGVRSGSEECDDGNTTDGDGCDTDCTYSCEMDAECQNATLCDGLEVCNVSTHACRAGAAPDCVDTTNTTNARGNWGPDCTVDSCDATLGCVHTLRDNDGDGFPPSSYVSGGTTYSCLGTANNDCNDIDSAVFPGAEEICDGRDNNCTAGSDETAPTWFIDCDGDGFAPRSAATTASAMFTGCTPPTSTGCSTPATARWTTSRPVPDNMATYDCNDANANVFPGQTTYGRAIMAPGSGYDWNCDGQWSQQVPNPTPCTTPPCLYAITCFNGTCLSDPGWSDRSAPACGIAEDFDYCVNGTNSCGTRTASRTQLCR